MGILKGIFYLLLLTLAIGFALYNDQAIALSYYFGWVSLSLPLFLWAFLFFFAGLLVSGVIAFLSKLGLRSRLYQQKKMLAELERRRIEAKRSAG